MRTIILILLGCLVLSSCNRPLRQAKYAADEFVGGAKCIECHKTEYDLWQGSHHDWAMKKPGALTAFGDFNDARFIADDEEYFFFRKNRDYYVRYTAVASEPAEYKIEYTFGVTPLQQYLIKFPDGKYQTLRATWDTDSNRWFNQYAGDTIPPNDWLHWQRGGQRWNTMCAECHSTNLVKGYDPALDQFTTTYDDINVNCEACHGPGGAHMNWAAQDDPLGDPKTLLGTERTEQLNMCAGCHARRTKLTEVMVSGEHFDDQFRIQTINDNFYHPDGQILEEDYVIGSFMQSKMFHKNVQCSNCHNAHSMDLIYKGNQLCMQCHEPQYDTKQHHFHEENTQAAQCIECHMTGDVYMGNDFRRDHSFRNPRPDQSVEYGTPNACNGCHTDQTAEWSAEWVVKWYGSDRPEHFSDYLLAAAEPPYDNETKKQLLDFIVDMDFPAIARATALEYYPILGSEAEVNMLLEALKDSAALVRYHALNKLSIFPLEERLGVALELARDTTRAVRIGSAELMIEQDLAQLPPESRGAALRAREELEAMLAANADFPTGRLQRGDYYFRQNAVQRAVNEYEMALQMDSLLTPVYSNLATGYNILGQNNKAVAALDKLVELEPGYARGFYLRGLLNFELGKGSQAISDLQTAVDLDPMNFRALLNLANLYFQKGDMTPAEKTILRALALEPESQEADQLLQLIKSRKATLP
jgi:tetratricopeptide (TPR) repeat protein/ssDNA-binding Zn-finger/Zn-ribbon topoisomerase 1